MKTAAKSSPYEVLGISSFCTEEEAKSRYRKLSMVYHPDNPETGDINKFLEIKKAWEEVKEYGFSNSGGYVWTHSTLFKIKSKRR